MNPAALARAGRAALGVGLAGLIACALGWATDERARVYQSWLWAFLFWAGLGVGCAGVLMIHQLVGGDWGGPLRKPLEAGAATALLLPAFFLPLLLGLDELYPWTREPLEEKRAYLNTPFFLLRSAAYFALWILGFLLLRRGDDAARRRLSGPGLLVYAFTLSFAAIDWAMSIEPHWSSSIYGLLFIAGQLLSTFAAAALAVVLLRAGGLDERRLHDLGNLLFMAVLLWAYVSFSQFLLIWSGNIPEEVAWYARRARGGWGLWAAALALVGFALPFFLLLRSDVKRAPRSLAVAAALVLVARLADTFWWVSPAFNPDGPRPHWLDLAAPAAIGGFWVASCLRRLEVARA